MHSTHTADVTATYDTAQLQSGSRYESLLSKAIASYSEVYNAAQSEADLQHHLNSIKNLCSAVPRKHRVFDLAKSLQALVLIDLGEPDNAQLVARQGIARRQDSSQCHHALGHVYLAQHRFTEAQSAFSEAISIAPDSLTYRTSLALCKLRQGNMLAAFNDYRALLSITPNNTHVRTQLVIAMQYIRASEYNHDLEKLLLVVFGWRDIDLEPVSYLANTLLCLKYDIAHDTTFMSLHRQNKCYLDTIEHDELFHTTLVQSGIRLPQFEQFVAYIRDSLVIALTCQHAISSLQRTLHSISEYQRQSGYLLPPHLIPNELVHNSLDTLDTDVQQALTSMYVSAPIFFGQKQTSLVAIDDIGCQVQAQYESFPYPCWRRLTPQNRSSYYLALKQHGLRPPSYWRQLDRPLRVLIAGCGTGKHAIQVAKYFSNVQILALDLSATSLAYAREQAIRFGINNIQFTQLDLLELTEHNPHFDVIECSGVMHHSQHPDTMMGNLINQLLPDGVIKLGLYSRIARAQVSMFRTENPSVNDVHEARQIVLNDTERYDQIIASPDFWHTSGVHDLLLNRFERQYNLIEVQRLLCQHGCEFINFAGLANEHHRRVTDLFNQNQQTLLETWHQYESEHPQLFAGMYQMYIKPTR